MASTTCAYCGRLTHMTPFGKQVKVIWSRFGGDRRATIQAPFTCDNCGLLSIASGESTSDPNDYNDNDSRWGWSERTGAWIPKIGVGREYPDVPKHIGAAASEAHECQSIGAHRAAVMLARAVIEATAKDKGITKGTLFDKIEKMHEHGLVSELVRDQAHEVRTWATTWHMASSWSLCPLRKRTRSWN